MTFRHAKALSRARKYRGKCAPHLAWYVCAQCRAKTGRFHRSAGATYWDCVTAEASLLSWALDRPEDDAQLIRDFNKDPDNALLSQETDVDVISSLGIKAFTQNNPEKAVALLSHLRVEFLELFLEYYLLGKSQSFLGRVHGCIQTRIWQTLRIAEQAVGAVLVLGAQPNYDILRPILEQNNLEQTPYGSLAIMIELYAQTQSYAAVAKAAVTPIPAIRKIFRPAIEKLLAAKDIKSVAVGCYLRNLTHQASLTGSGLSKQVSKRLKRMRVQNFEAPATQLSPLFNFGKVASLGDTPWAMLEIASEHRMAQITPLIHKQGKRIFGTVPAQVFAPTNSEGDLLLGYIFARCLNPKLAYALRQIRGITDLSAVRDDSDRITKVITVPHSELLPTIRKEERSSINVPRIRLGDFVEIQTGEAAKYCGTVVKIKGLDIHIEVRFPSHRIFHITADPTAIKLLENVNPCDRAFWGVYYMKWADKLVSAATKEKPVTYYTADNPD